MRKTAFGLYLIAMAIVDFITIWAGLTRHFIKNYYNVSEYTHIYYICVYETAISFYFWQL